MCHTTLPSSAARRKDRTICPEGEIVVRDLLPSGRQQAQTSDATPTQESEVPKLSRMYRNSPPCKISTTDPNAALSSGWQQKLIEARLAAAQQKGCDLAATSVLPGSVSHRNYERAGFQLVYMRVVLTRDLTVDPRMLRHRRLSNLASFDRS
jgi:hypothetical protein